MIRWLIFKYFLIKYNIKNMCDYSENNINCCKKKSYGEYCNKHKRNHIVKNDLIIFNNFTYRSSDYLIDDIDYTEISPSINDSISPYIIASFDIDRDISLVDFPLPKKDFNKYASDIYDSFQSMIYHIYLELCENG